jgi:hypothetical protein
MFQLADHEYNVSHAAIELFDRTEEGTVCWGLKIIGEPGDGSDDMAHWKPAILSDVLLETQPGQISHWYDIAGTTIAWDEPNEDPQALLEVYETSAIYKCKWQFLAVPGNKRVRLVVDGFADIDEDHGNVPIHLDTLLGVAPWLMARMPEQECLALYQRLGFKDPVEFCAQKHGVSSLIFLNQ